MEHLEWGMGDGWLSSPTRLESFDKKLQFGPLFFLSKQGGLLLALHSLLEGWLVVSTYRLIVNMFHVLLNLQLGVTVVYLI